MTQFTIPDIEQMALFSECLDAHAPNKGLQEVLEGGNASELGELLRQLDYKALRIELMHCEYTLPEHCTNKTDLIDHFWSDFMRALKSNTQYSHHSCGKESCSEESGTRD